MAKHNRFPFQSTALALVLALLTATSLAVAQTSAEAEKSESDVPGQRVFNVGHSFHYFMPPILSKLPKRQASRTTRQLAFQPLVDQQ